MPPKNFLIKALSLTAIATALAAEPMHNLTSNELALPRDFIRSNVDGWFTQLEDVLYSVVQYIPGIGTVYSLKRASVTYRKRDWIKHWQSVVKFLEASARDTILVTKITEPVVVTVIHSMAESFGDKMLDLYNEYLTETRLEIDQVLDKESGHILISESPRGKSEAKVFQGMAKGLHHFHGAVFEGVLKEPSFSWKGEKIRMHMHEGLFPGAMVTFTWRWTMSAFGNPNSPAATLGIIDLKKDGYGYTGFRLSRRHGSGGWAGYNFWGQIISYDHILAETSIDGEKVKISLVRVPGT